jgi:hypothetical protein
MHVHMWTVGFTLIDRDQSCPITDCMGHGNFSELHVCFLNLEYDVIAV